jgi:hypothetical protein
LREDTQKLKEEKTTLEGMVESRDELIWRWLKSMDSTAWSNTTMRMTEETPLHPLHLRHLLMRTSLRRIQPFLLLSCKDQL